MREINIAVFLFCLGKLTGQSGGKFLFQLKHAAKSECRLIEHLSYDIKYIKMYKSSKHVFKCYSYI